MTHHRQLNKKYPLILLLNLQEFGFEVDFQRDIRKRDSFKLCMKYL